MEFIFRMKVHKRKRNHELSKSTECITYERKISFIAITVSTVKQWFPGRETTWIDDVEKTALGTINPPHAQRCVSRDLSAPRATLSSLCELKRLIIRATGTNIELSVSPQPLSTITLLPGDKYLFSKKLFCCASAFLISMLAPIG